MDMEKNHFTSICLKPPEGLSNGANGIVYFVNTISFELLSNEFKLKICYNAYAWDTRLTDEKTDL